MLVRIILSLSSCKGSVNIFSGKKIRLKSVQISVKLMPWAVSPIECRVLLYYLDWDHGIRRVHCFWRPFNRIWKGGGVHAHDKPDRQPINGSFRINIEDLDNPSLSGTLFPSSIHFGRLPKQRGTGWIHQALQGRKIQVGVEKCWSHVADTNSPCDVEDVVYSDGEQLWVLRIFCVLIVAKEFVEPQILREVCSLVCSE